MLGVSPQEAFVGLSSNAVCSIIAVIIIGAGLDKTGVMDRVAWAIMRYGGKAESQLVGLTSGAVAFIST